MASRREEKERLRAERRALESQDEAEARRKRLIQYGSATVLTAIVAVGILVLLSQSGSNPGGDTNLDGTSEVAAQLKGIPQKGTVLGELSAKATITEFGDLQCPVCKAFSNDEAPELIDGPVRKGEAKYDFRQWTIIGPDSKTAAAAALAAGEQGRYWNFIELFYRNQGTEETGYVTDDFLESVAKGAGVPDIGRWNKDREESRWSSRLDAIDAQATNLGFSGTPALMVEGPGGRKLFTDSIPTAAEIEAAIAQVG